MTVSNSKSSEESTRTISSSSTSFSTSKSSSKVTTNANDDHLPWFPALMCYCTYALLIIFGHIREFFGRLTGVSRYHNPNSKRRMGYAELLTSWESFYTKRVYHRIQDVFQRPVCSAPGATIDIYERYSTDGNKTMLINKALKPRRCTNLGSYNYLGFADDWTSTCSQPVLQVLEKYAVASTSSAREYGVTPVHIELEKKMAWFLKKPAAIVYNMGYATNSCTIPVLMGKGCLILSDTLNHSSIVNGARSSEATVRVFKNNDAKHLEVVLRRAIAYGQPRTRRPWRKILVMVEGIYSMEGTILDLKEIHDVCKKYKAYLYVDEAHSIGALGETGRGVCEYRGVNHEDVDILMGTFTKSFAGMGGYIAASQEIIDHIRANSAGMLYCTSLSPIIASQILTALKIICGEDGTNIGAAKLKALRENSRFFHEGIAKLGVNTIGNSNESPVLPMLIYSPMKLGVFSQLCFEKNLAVVSVGFPATPLLLGRARFCISAAHTKESLAEAIQKLDEITQEIHIQFKRRMFG